MGQVAVTLSVMPSSETDVQTLEDLVRNQISNMEGVELKSVSQNPIAFGLKSLKILIIMPDSEGGTDKIEEEISTVDGVESVKIEDTTII